MKTVVFDIDDTLYDQIQPFKQAISATFSLSDLEKKQIHIKPLFKKFRYFSDLAFSKTVDGSLTLEDMRINRIIDALNSFGFYVTEEQAVDFQKNYLFYQGKISLLEEMKLILTDLSQKDTPLAILTNGPSEHQKAKIKQLGTTDFISKKNHFISGEVGMAKPDIAIFEHIEKQLNTSAENLIYIGDSYENDVIGAKKAGWQCIWLNKNKIELRSKDILPDIELADSRELAQALNRLLND